MYTKTTSLEYSWEEAERMLEENLEHIKKKEKKCVVNDKKEALQDAIETLKEKTGNGDR